MYTCANCEATFPSKRSLIEHQDAELTSTTNVAAESSLDIYTVHQLFIQISQIAWHDEPNWSTGLSASEREKILSIAREGIHITRPGGSRQQPAPREKGKAK